MILVFDIKNKQIILSCGRMQLKHPLQGNCVIPLQGVFLYYKPIVSRKTLLSVSQLLSELSEAAAARLSISSKLFSI